MMVHVSCLPDHESCRCTKEICTFVKSKQRVCVRIDQQESCWTLYMNFALHMKKDRNLECR